MAKYTFKNGDTLEMKALKHSAFASEETHCYEAKLYFNGKPFALASNAGHGGADYYEPIGNFTHLHIRGVADRCRDEMPKWEMCGDTHDTTLEIWCGESVNDLLALKEMKKLLRSRILYQDPEDKSGVYQLTFKNTRQITKQHIEYVARKYPSYVVLNSMSESEAFGIFKNQA